MPSKKRLKLAASIGVLLLVWPVSSPLRANRASSLANQAAGVYSSDPVKAIAMLKTAAWIKSSPEIQARLDTWLLVPEVQSRPAGTKAVSLASRLAAIREFDSAEKVLESAGSLNSSGTALLAKLRLANNHELEDTRGKLEAAIANDPADISLHELLMQVHKELGNQQAASEEAAKIDRLKSGKP